MSGRILGAIAALWGGLILFGNLTGFSDSQPWLHSSYTARQIKIMIFGGMLFVVGAYYLIKGSKPRDYRA